MLDCSFSICRESFCYSSWDAMLYKHFGRLPSSVVILGKQLIKLTMSIAQNAQSIQLVRASSSQAQILANVS